MPHILVADSGSTKTDWSLISSKKTATLSTTGMSPYFVDENVYLVTFFGKNGATPIIAL